MKRMGIKKARNLNKYMTLVGWGCELEGDRERYID